MTTLDAPQLASGRGGTRVATAGTLVAVAAGALVYCGLLAYSAGGFPDHDAFVMARVARDVLSGKALYTEAWDIKAPLALLFYAPPAWVAPGSYLALQVWLALWLLGQAALLWFGLGPRIGAARAIAPTLLLLLPLQQDQWIWASSEHAANLFVLAMLVVAWRISVDGTLRLAECAAAGAALALTANTRQGLVLLGAVPALAIALHAPAARRLRALGAFAAGGVAGQLAVTAVVLVATHGELAPYARAMLGAPAGYGLGWSHARWLVLSYRTDVVLFLLFVSAAIASTGRARALAASVAATTLAAVFLPLRGYPHYWVQAFPAVALLAPLAVDALGVAPSRRAAVQGLAVAGFLAAAGVIGTLELGGRDDARVMSSVARRIEAAARPGDTLFAAGAMSAYLYFATDLGTVHPIFWQNWLRRNELPILPFPLPDVLSAYAARPPTVIALDARTESSLGAAPSQAEEPDVRLLRGLLASDAYRVAARDGGWVVLRRAPAAAP